MHTFESKVRSASPAFAVVIATIVLASCGLLPNTGAAAPVAVSELRHETICYSASASPAVTLLKDVDALRAWQQVRNVDLIHDDPLPDGPFAVVENGTRSTGGYGVVVSRNAGIVNGVMTLNASFLSPPENSLRSQIVTSPCVLIALPAGNYTTVELLDTRGRRIASSATPPAPTAATSTPAQ